MQPVIDLESLLVNIDWHNPRAFPDERVADIGITRIFEADRSLGGREQCCSEIERILRAHCDQHLIGRCDNAAARQEL
jgi:hypothetical protein